MTRHGMIQHSAAGYRPAATGLRTPVVIADADRLMSAPAPGRQPRTQSQRSGLSAYIPALSVAGRATADISRKPKSP